MEFDSVLTFASYASESLPLDRLTSMLLECENRQKQFVFEVSVQANLIQQSALFGSSPVEQSSSIESYSSDLSPRDRASYHGRGRPQCQLCGRLGHVAQKCYYQFYRLFGDSSPTDKGFGFGYNPNDAICYSHAHLRCLCHMTHWFRPG